MRVLIYADVDLNLIDGSSIWLAAVAELLGGVDGIAVDVLQRNSLRRTTVVEDVRANANVTFIDARAEAAADPNLASLLALYGGRHLTAEAAAGVIRALDRRRPYHLIVVRSIDACVALCDVPTVAARTWAYVTDPDRHRTPEEAAKLRRISDRCRRLLCQTEAARAALRDIIDADTSGDISLLPPTIGALDVSRTVDPNEREPRLVYAGKLSVPYMVIEMLDAFAEIRRRIPGAEFHVVGDKFNRSAEFPGFGDEAKRRLCATPGVTWHGGLSRSETRDVLRLADVASSWRAPMFDQSLELSTKVLEYASLGLPVLTNPSPVQFSILGPSYAGYVREPAEFVDRFIALIADPALFRATASHLRSVAARFTYQALRQSLVPILREDAAATTEARQAEPNDRLATIMTPFRASTSAPASSPRVDGRAALGVRSWADNGRRPTHVLFASHDDLKFARLLLSRFATDPAYRLTFDLWKNDKSDHTRRHQPAPTADLIFCEWCLGNAEWYSKHKLPHQKLVIRLHRHELERPFINRIEWDQVDRLIFVTEHFRQSFLRRVPAMAARSLVIRNFIDVASYAAPRTAESRFNLGLLGFSPRLKAPHLAVRMIERLYRLDSRYRLQLKGRHLWESFWLWNRPAERAYYEDLYRAIRAETASEAIVFGAFGDDVPRWFEQVGIILSTSEVESCHLAVVEGMAAGAVPIVRHWPGADWQYPAKYLCSFDEEAFVEEAIAAVLSYEDERGFLIEGDSSRRFAREQFDAAHVLRRYDAMINELVREDDRLPLRA